jgi:hypothetical protein
MALESHVLFFRVCSVRNSLEWLKILWDTYIIDFLESAFSDQMFLEMNSLDHSPDRDPLNCHRLYPCRAKGDRSVFYQVGHWHNANLFWAIGNRISHMPSAIHQQDIRAHHHWSQLDPLPSPQFLTEETSSWPVCSACQTFILLDGQLFTPIKRYHSILPS